MTEKNISMSFFIIKTVLPNAIVRLGLKDYLRMANMFPWLKSYCYTKYKLVDWMRAEQIKEGRLRRYPFEFIIDIRKIIEYLFAHYTISQNDIISVYNFVFSKGQNLDFWIQELIRKQTKIRI